MGFSHGYSLGQINLVQMSISFLFLWSLTFIKGVGFKGLSRKLNGAYLYYTVYVLINQQQQNLKTAIRRNEVFRRELPLALTAIRYGDRFLFDLYPSLDHEPIIVNFISTYPQLFKQERLGTFSSFSM